MWDYISYLVMVPMVYVAFTTLILGIIFKVYTVYKSPSIPARLGVYPQDDITPVGIIKDSLFWPVALKKSPLLWGFLMVFHLAIVFLIIGHMELISDFRVLQIIPHDVFLGAGALGMILIVSTLYFLFRRFRSPFREISIPEDYLLLIILFFSILFGTIFHMSARYGSYSELVKISAGDFREYFMGLITFKPVLSYKLALAPHFIVLVLHVFFSNLFIILFPFSKMIHSLFIFFAISLKRK